MTHPKPAADGKPHPLLATPLDELRQRAVKGVAATASAQAIKLIVQFASVVVLARLLNPSDFGIYAMVTPIIGFAMLFQDFGLSQALITAPTLTQSQAAGMFRVNMLLATSLACLLALCAPLIGHFYHEPAVVGVTLALAAQIVLVGATVSHTALLARAMQFKKIAVIDSAASLGGFGAALLLAMTFPSPWALVAQSLGSAAVTLIAAWLMTRWLPTGRSSFNEIRSMLNFGVGMTSFNLTNFLSRNADNVLIGWTQGAGPLGLYDRAYKLLLFPLIQINGPVANVMVPVLSRLVAEPERYRAAYLRTLRQILLVTVPGVTFMIVTADVLIPTLMGPEWVTAVDIFRWLGLAAIHQTISNTFGWLFVSQRRTGEYARFGLISTTSCLVAFVAGLPWGAVGVAAAYGISGLLFRLPLIVWTVGRRGPVQARAIATLFLPYAIAIVISGLVTWSLAGKLGLGPYAYLGATLCAIYAICWATIGLFKSGRATFRDTLGLIPNIRRKPPTKPA